ncbi:MAG: hypothetical protein OHK93_006877 [Ramalina farinacea]|uniref:Citrate synthase n=1 Tax=Ramalina farinacea TaxID=258253 RepID=A0AA43TX45_9LECA|nr:hypothetical protein [Ramalina farinacea]
MLFQFSRGSQSFFSLRQSQSKESSSGQLTVIDSRTSRRYQIPIANNAVQAVDIGRIFIGDEFDYSERVNNALKVLDPGFSNTAVMTSSVTFVYVSAPRCKDWIALLILHSNSDGMKGEIYYRDHSIDDLFGHVSFEEVAHLLIWNHLPSPEERARFRASLNARLSPPASAMKAINILPRDAPPVSVIIAGLAAYAAANPSKVPTTANDPLMYRSNMQVIDNGILDSLATMAVVISLLYCHQRGHAFLPANPDKSFIENVLIMMGFVDKTTDLPHPRTVRTLDSLWILYLDHEMTNSTAALLHVASTLADPISCCIGMVASANGPLHGGAIDLAYKKFEELESPSNVPALIKDVKAKKLRLFGYGHRIYKTVDPRAKYLRAMLEEFSEESKSNPLLAIAMEIDREASTDEYFTSRNLKANADLYGCFVYTAL